MAASTFSVISLEINGISEVDISSLVGTETSEQLNVTSASVMLMLIPNPSFSSSISCFDLDIYSRSVEQ